MKMEVYTPNLELIGILESYDNLIIEDCAFTSGTFSFNSILNSNTRELLKEDNIVWFDAETAGIIEYFDKTSSEDGVSFTIKGNLLTGLLKRRVLWGLYNFNASPTKIMYDTVTDCAITPTRGNIEARKIPNLALAEQPEDARTIRKQQTGGDLLSFCEEVGQATNTAFGVAFDALTPSMKFWCRPCKNRTIHQSENEPVFYSTELDDVLSANYSYDASNYKNVAFVQGEGEGVNRANTTVYSETEPQGMSRYEMYVDAKDLQKNSDPEKPMTDAEYLKALTTRGQEKLSDAQLVQNFDANIRTLNPTYVYGKDFFLGDTITVIDKNLGVTVDAVVESVQRSFGSQGEQLSFTFGYSTPLLSQKLRKAGI